MEKMQCRFTDRSNDKQERHTNHPLVHLLKNLPEANQAEVVDIFQYMLQRHPAASVNQMESCKAALDLVVRLDLKLAFPEEVNIGELHATLV